MEVDLPACPDASSSRKRRRKGRIIQKGYHKYERSDARRVAAREFLSNISLDNHILPRSQNFDDGTVHEPAEGVISRPISSASRHSNAVILTEEHLEMFGEGRLGDIALDSLPQLQHQSPSKLLASKSLDYGFGTPSPSNYKPVPFSHSISVMDSQSGDRRSAISALAHKRQLTMDTGPAIYSLSSLSYAHAELLPDSR